MSRVCVIGAGPAGCVFAARLAQLGHVVTLVERLPFPRTALGESLTPGVLPLLAMIGAREPVETAGFTRVRSVMSTWEGEVRERDDPGEGGLLVDRGRFDGLLLERARAVGVRVLQPGTVCERQYVDGAWRLRIATPAGTIPLEADYLADAAGRRGAWPGRRRRDGVPTVALYAYWRGATLPRQPRIEAGLDAWYWGVPLPDGRYNTLAFVDASRVREHRGRRLDDLFRDCLSRSGLMPPGLDASPDGPIRAIDATPYLAEDGVTMASIRIGDAAAALDALSSSGVQKAIQNALAGAVVANTILRRPDSGAAAMQFFRSAIADAVLRHRAWAASHYATVASRQPAAFWLARANGAAAATLPPRSAGHSASPVTREDEDGARRARLLTSLAGGVRLSPLLEFVDQPCLGEEFVTIRPAVRHPQLDSPVAYLGPWPIEPLLRHVRPGMTAMEIVGAWSERVPPRTGLAIASWLLDHRLLVPAASGAGGITT